MQYDAAGNRVRVGGSFARTAIPEAIAVLHLRRGEPAHTTGDEILAMTPTGT